MNIKWEEYKLRLTMDMDAEQEINDGFFDWDFVLDSCEGSFDVGYKSGVVKNEILGTENKINKIKCKLCGAVDEYDKTYSGTHYCTNCEDEIYVGRIKSILPWIDVSDRLPDNNDPVIIFCTPLYGEPYRTTGYLYDNAFFDGYRTVRVLCWCDYPDEPIFE